jgi:hypothetical protein
MAADVKIDIAAEFTGKKAFRQAETATDKMSKNVKKLAGALGLAFGGQAILSYGKKAIKAAAEDEKAQKQLALALKNVGLERDAASTEAYIQNLQSEFGILDDKLRPAYQTLAIATQDTAESQRLLNLSLDIAASTGKDLGSVTSALSRAYLGNNTALSKLGVGISKADLKAKSFQDITNELQKTFAGSAQSAANTFQGSIDKLGVAAANASEIIGTGLIDALKGLGDEDSVDSLATSMQNVAIYTADVIRGIGELVGQLNKIPGFKGAGIEDYVQLIPILGSYLSLLAEAGRIPAGSGINAQGLAHLAELQSRYTTTILKTKTKITAEELKALKAARLKAALDKANLALSKGEEVFDMDKIQNAAALANQAEQLGKATNGTQLLQIANDTARLNVKKSISDLEDAMATKDEAAIKAATAKLNADLGILAAMTGQDAKLTTIKSILDSLKPKDLINLDNLEKALALLKQIALGGGTTGGGASSLGAPSMPSSLNPIKGAGGVRAPRAFTTSELQYFDTAGDYLYAGSPLEAMFAAGSSGSSGTAGNTIIVNTGVGDPNAIAEAIDQVLTDAAQRGTLRQYATP